MNNNKHPPKAIAYMSKIQNADPIMLSYQIMKKIAGNAYFHLSFILSEAKFDYKKICYECKFKLPTQECMI